MPNSDGDIGEFIRGLPYESGIVRSVLPCVGIDECFNRTEISDLVKKWFDRGLIDRAGPLWYETRGRDGVVLCSTPGGISRDSELRGPNPLIDDIGIPMKHRSWSDFRVAKMLVAKFIHHESLILLSENIRNNADGLRRILNEVVGPALADRNDQLNITAIFKKGKTPIIDYCTRATEHLENSTQGVGYREILL